MTFSIGGKLAGGLFTATSVSATVAAPYVPKLIDKYVLTSSSSKVESFSSDSSYLEESEIVVSDESLAPQTVDQSPAEAPKSEIKDAPKVEKEEVVAYTIKQNASELSGEKLEENQGAYETIKQWLGKNGSCEISFMISTVERSALDFSKISKDNMKDDSIFSTINWLRKSKFKSFADQLNSGDASISEYIKALSEKCEQGSIEKLYLHWRNEVKENNKFKGLKNVWIDHKTLRVGSIDANIRLIKKSV